MSISFQCPECQETVKVSASLAGMHSPCPSCYVSVAVPEVAFAVAGQDLPRTEIRARGDVLFHLAPPPEKLTPPWRWVLVGLPAIAASGLLFFLIATLDLVPLVITPQTGRTRIISSVLLTGATGFAQALGTLAAILFLGGIGSCLAVPREAKARRWIAIAWAVAALGILVVVGHAILRHRSQQGMPITPGTLPRLETALVVSFLLEHILILVFARALAIHFNDDTLGRQGLWLIGAVSALTVLIAVLTSIPVESSQMQRVLLIVTGLAYILLAAALGYLLTKSWLHVRRGVRY